MITGVLKSSFYFNPRSREGSDPATARLTVFSVHISIHAPARGATFIVLHLGQTHVISIHAPARGATSTDFFKHPVYCNFNPRSREGSDSALKKGVLDFGISIHAPARGATLLPLAVDIT